MKEWLGFAGSLFAGVGLFLTAWQMGRTRRVSNLQALQKFFESANAHEAALMKASGDADAQIYALNEFLNFLELYAAAYNHKLLFGKAAEKMVRHKLADCCVELDAAPREWRTHIEKANDRSTTFEELRKFMNRNRAVIEQKKAERAAQTGAS